MAASPYTAYQAGMMQAAAIAADEALDATFARFVSLYGKDGRDISTHALWNLLNQAQPLLAEIRKQSEGLATDAMTGAL